MRYDAQRTRRTQWRERRKIQKGIARRASFQVRNVASHAMSRPHIQTLAAERSGNGVLQLVRGRHAASPPDILVKVIDSTVIDEMPPGAEHRNLRRNLHPALF